MITHPKSQAAIDIVVASLNDLRRMLQNFERRLKAVETAIQRVERLKK